MGRHGSLRRGDAFFASLYVRGWIVVMRLSEPTSTSRTTAATGRLVGSWERAKTSCGCRRTHPWCFTTAATKICGGTKTGTGRTDWRGGPGAPVTRSTYSRASSPSWTQLGPTAQNSPSSPGFDLSEVNPNDPDHGCHHQWDVWNQIDYSAYRSEIPRFCSEFGFQAPPAWRTLLDSVHAVDGQPLDALADPKSDANFLLHQKALDGNGKLDRGLAPHLGVPVDFADWHWATQLNQARAVTYAIDHYRRWWPRTAGAIVWQLNDCWPVTSWASIDSLGRLKPMWYALRRAFAPRNLVFGVDSEQLLVAVLNDTTRLGRATFRSPASGSTGRSWRPKPSQ